MAEKEYANSGVDGSGGYEFQKHCALYIFLENYNDMKNQKYFISLEHYEDFLFCYLDEKDLITNIDSFQAKKSSKEWTLTKKFKEIIQKILQVGIDLKNDSIPKIDTYSHNLYFVSNREINLSKTVNKKPIKNIINERNNTIKYSELYEEIKNEILSLTDANTKEEIDNLLFYYIDFAKEYESQKLHLIGKFGKLFGNRVLDHKASVETLLSLFRDIENTFNQGNIVSLMDKSKRVESQKIDETINIITTKQKAFDEWRSKKDEYSKILKIPPKARTSFELAFQNAFDYLKDLEQVEHKKIFNFVDSIDLSYCYTDEDCLEIVVNNFTQTYNTQFNEITTKAIILASYIQIREED